eukprot:1138678-Pelagomonas_calceolata.AAC.6
MRVQHAHLALRGSAAPGAWHRYRPPSELCDCVAIGVQQGHAKLSSSLPAPWGTWSAAAADDDDVGHHDSAAAAASSGLKVEALQFTRLALATSGAAAPPTKDLKQLTQAVLPCASERYYKVRECVVPAAKPARRVNV